jgi:hypothetical protein
VCEREKGVQEESTEVNRRKTRTGTGKDLQVGFKATGGALVGENNVREAIVEDSTAHVRVDGQFILC